MAGHPHTWPQEHSEMAVKSMKKYHFSPKSLENVSGSTSQNITYIKFISYNEFCFLTLFTSVFGRDRLQIHYRISQISWIKYTTFLSHIMWNVPVNYKIYFNLESRDMKNSDVIQKSRNKNMLYYKWQKNKKKTCHYNSPKSLKKEKINVLLL